MGKKTILVNGKVYSISQDNSVVKGTAIAIEGEKISKVGTDDEVKACAGDDVQVIDCHGNTILPGLCDAHCHPSIAAGLYAGCDLYGIYIQEGETPDDVIDSYIGRLKKFIDEHPDDELYRGSGWVINNFPEDRMPSRHDIDKICRDKPVILESFCIHYAWVNTKAIELAGVTADTPDVFAGKIHREEDGYPSGLFSQPEAMNLVKLKVPGYDFSVEKYKEAFLYYQKEYANKYGVTFLQDCMHSDNAREAYVQLAREGKMTVRARGVYVLEPSKFKKQLAEFIRRKGRDNVNNDFRIDTVKIFSEGEFVFSEPYEKKYLEENGLAPTYNGALYWTNEDLTSSVKKAMEAGFNIHVHAMGDKAIKQSVNCLAAAQKETGLQSRNIVAHLMLVDDETAKTMGEEKIIANCMPRWMVYDSDIYGMVPMIGQARAERSYPYRIFLNEGVVVTFGTDFPVTPPPDTMHEIQCVMTRSVFPDAPDYERFKGKVLGDERPATLQEAIKSISINGAYQMFGESITGSIEEGKSAELVILDSDIEGIPVEEIYNVHVEKTIFKGRVVYEK